MKKTQATRRNATIAEGTVPMEYYTRITLLCVDAVLIGWNVLRILAFAH